MAEELHAEHRKRTLKKFRQNGSEAFADHEMLEMMLFFSIPRVNTNTTGHRLLNYFGSFHEIFDAPFEQLCEVEGIGERSATLIKLISAIMSRYKTSQIQADRNSAKLINRSLVANYFLPQFIGKIEESLLVAFLDSKCRVIKCEELAIGSNTRVDINCSLIARRALLYNTAGIAIAHNHPNGVPIPSPEDIDVTNELTDLLRRLDIQLVAHCIVAGSTASFVGYEYEKYTFGE